MTEIAATHNWNTNYLVLSLNEKKKNSNSFDEVRITSNHLLLFWGVILIMYYGCSGFKIFVGEYENLFLLFQTDGSIKL